MAQLTWPEREGPILEAIAQAEETGGDVDRAARQAVLDLDDGLYQRTVLALHEDGYIEVERITSAWGGVVGIDDLRLLPKGRRAVGQWPSGDAGDVLLSLLQAAHDQEANPDRKGRLGRVIEGLGGMGKTFVTDLAVSIAKGVAGVP